jgi:CBS domain containing-hemolysin-like protein
MSTGFALVLSVLLIAGNAFFVGAEFAVVSARRSAMEPLAAAGSKRARTMLYAMEHVSLMLACSQLGITVCSISLGVITEPAVAALIEPGLAALGVPAAAVHPVAVTLALSLVVYLHVVLGEMVPKNLAISGPDRAALIFGPPLVWIARVLRPLIASLNWLANGVVRAVGVQPRTEVLSAFTAEEVQSIVERSQSEGLLTDEQGLLTGALQFSDRTASEVMISMSELVTLQRGCTADDLERLVTRTGFSRFPVVDGDVPIGYLHLKDVLFAGPGDRDRPVPDWRVRALAQVGPDDEVEEALAAMQRSGTHLARVSRGGDSRALGVIFLEDILEELVGEVRDAMQRRQAR